MKEIKKYNNMKMELESIFKGLPHGPAYLVSLLSTKVDPSTGLIEENISYRSLADFLAVYAAPGRKNAGTPQKETIRSYLRTIEAQCGDHFKVISVGQSLQIQFPTLPNIYANHFGIQEVYTGQNDESYTAAALINTEDNAINETEENTDQYTHPYTEEYTVAINASAYAPAKIKQTKTNKQTDCDSELSIESKKPITDDFFPSVELIALALTRGLENITDEGEIKKFILYNQASGSLRVNYNPLYLRWLERAAEHKAKLLNQSSFKQPSGRNHESNGYWNNAATANTHFEHKHNGGCVSSRDNSAATGFRPHIFEEYCVALGRVDSYVRQALPQPSRCPR